jgi:hypothetical protein
MFLLQVGKETISDKLNDLPAFEFPPNEAIEVKDDFIAHKIMEHLRLFGLVEVPLIKSKGGILYDVETAKKTATIALRAGRKEMVDRYIKTQREDRIRENKPPLPPSPVVRKIIEEDGIDLAKRGINLAGVGFDIANQPAELVERLNKLEADNALIVEQNRLLSEQNALLKQQQDKKKTAA